MSNKAFGRSRMTSRPIDCKELSPLGHSGFHRYFRTPTSTGSSLYLEIPLQEENLAAEEKSIEIDGLPREKRFAFNKERVWTQPSH
jgi:hypothetical protein